MPAYQVQRSIVILADPESVFDTVADYATWTKWSPWLCIDKDAVVTVSDDSNSLKSLYSWQGEVVGQGEIEHVKLDRPSLIEDEIRFVKPFKSRSDVKFACEPVAGGTKVTWSMDGSLPWFLFWMKSMMQTIIGMDYERGLRMLKEYIETGKVLSDCEVVGVESVDGRDMFGIRSSAPTNDVGPAMREACDQVAAAAPDIVAAHDTERLSLYHPCDLKKGRFDFTTGYTATNVTDLPAGLVHCQVPAGKCLLVRHTGSYENLGNAWSGAHQYARYKKLKLAKRDAFEIYRNSPETTATEDLITDVYIPLK